MYARVSTIQVKRGKMDECVSTVASMIALSQKTRGNKAGILLVDRNHNNPPPAEREVLGSPPEGGTAVGKPRWG